VFVISTDAIRWPVAPSHAATFACSVDASHGLPPEPVGIPEPDGAVGTGVGSPVDALAKGEAAVDADPVGGTVVGAGLGFEPQAFATSARTTMSAASGAYPRRE
jgi:hypothetical protein